MAVLGHIAGGIATPAEKVELAKDTELACEHDSLLRPGRRPHQHWMASAKGMVSSSLQCCRTKRSASEVDRFPCCAVRTEIREIDPDELRQQRLERPYAGPRYNLERESGQ